MKERLQFLLIYYGFWVIFFLVARVIFLGYHIEDTKLLTLQTIWGIFWNGIRMDFSMAGYLSVIPFLLVSLSNFIKKSRLENWIFSYTFLMVLIANLIIVIDLQVFNTWGYHLDATPLRYLKTPREAWASVSSSPLVQLFISFLILLVVASLIVYRIITKNIDNWNHIDNIPFIPIAIVCTLALFVPIRGSLGISPMNQSTVYFSTNNFANIAAVNPTWNFFSSLVNGSYDKVNPYTYLPKEELSNNIKELYENSNTTNSVIRNDIKKPNVLIIIWESFTRKVTSRTIGGTEVTPRFNELKKEGIYFSNMFASGDRTDKGIPAILSGYPAQPMASIITEPNKSSKLPVLSKDFENNSYSTDFYYGGEVEFANIKSYLYSADFQKIVSKQDFDSKYWNSKWGAHDDIVFKKYLNDHSTINQPFFSTILTLSSHEPFEIPTKNTFEGDDEESKFMNAMFYADQSLGNFIDSAKRQPWWSNTLIIIVADHGHRIPETDKKVDDFKIPMLWLGGALAKHGFEMEGIASQIDISATLLKQLGLDAYAYNWSKNIFDPKTKQWAFFSFNNGFGFIQPKQELIFDNIGKKMIQLNGSLNTHDIDLGKALMQRTFQDYLDK
ncbi:LTA synthase family protein [Emticicia sp. BO119]|uniref:LTA synthase family protein n=1 Tax=Emticicia sp. BO119 TaxID=2757768 RepID=UPI0015F0AD6A|nr:alkaline phosphatase family protein [Emticicia sp. BO119]MBA4853604.1 sulfatase-like hydrolase/transferase [Emticicia sp. BO119]